MPNSTTKTHPIKFHITGTNPLRGGGGGWIRTNVGVSQQIYSLPPLATRAPLRRTADYSTIPTPKRRCRWRKRLCTGLPVACTDTMHIINLALQGGGSHGAFTWGVLDALLE